MARSRVIRVPQEIRLSHMKNKWGIRSKRAQLEKVNSLMEDRNRGVRRIMMRRKKKKMKKQKKTLMKKKMSKENSSKLRRGLTYHHR